MNYSIVFFNKRFLFAGFLTCASMVQVSITLNIICYHQLTLWSSLIIKSGDRGIFYLSIFEESGMQLREDVCAI